MTRSAASPLRRMSSLPSSQATIAEKVIRLMYAPVIDVHWVTVKQLAYLGAHLGRGRGLHDRRPSERGAPRDGGQGRGSGGSGSRYVVRPHPSCPCQRTPW